MATKMVLSNPDSITEENVIEMMTQLGEGATLREMRGITDAEMEAIYAMGVNFYKAGNYDDAEKVFKFLVMFDHMSSRYWTAMGSLRQVQRRFAQAVEAYKFASFLDLENPKPLYYAAECLVALGDKAKALDALAAVDEFAAKDAKGAQFRAKAAALRALIEK